MEVTLKRAWFAGKQYGRFRAGRQEVPDALADLLPSDAVVHHMADEPDEAPEEEVEESLRDYDVARVQAAASQKVVEEAEARQEAEAAAKAAAKATPQPRVVRATGKGQRVKRAAPKK